jgi:MYXO-CTERM domain-containing protein
MTEVSHSEKPFDDFDNVRGRAIHIHDELVYADAAAFFGMNAMWDSVSHAQHYMGRADPGFYSETDTVVLIDVALNKVVISGMGRAIGHYARWLRRGAARVEATTADPLVLATAFVDSSQGRVVIVAINNATADRPLDIAVSGVALAGTVEGELSKAGALWIPVTGVSASGGHVKYQLPTHAVVTLSAAIAGAVSTDAGAEAATTTGAGGNATAGGAGNAPSGAGGGTNPMTNVDGAAPTAGTGGAAAGESGGGPSLTGAGGGAADSPDSAVSSPSGCGCRTDSSRAPRPAVLGIAMLAAGFFLRRRQRSTQ